jgi:hypothetical protein
MVFIEKFEWMTGVLVNYDACRRVASKTWKTQPEKASITLNCDTVPGSWLRPMVSILREWLKLSVKGTGWRA